MNVDSGLRLWISEQRKGDELSMRMRYPVYELIGGGIAVGRLLSEPARDSIITADTISLVYNFDYHCIVQVQTRFQKSWDTVQIVNKNRMQ